MTQPPVAPSQWAPPPPAPDPLLPGGLVVAGMGRRIGAYIVDEIILTVVGFAFLSVLGSMGIWYSKVPANGDALSATYNYPVVVAYMAFGLAVSAAYWVFSWSAMRASLGMRMVGLQIGDATTGNNLTTAQAVRRWIALGAPFALAQIVQPITVVYYAISIVELIWIVALLVSTVNHPLRRGIHDRYAGSLIVQAL